MDMQAGAVDAIGHLLALSALRPGEVPQEAKRTALHSLLDTLVVMRAGLDEPVAVTVRNMVLAEAGSAAATLAGTSVRVPPRAAALANGTAAHALDYDDTHFGHVGHVSVAVLPAAMAAGEASGRSAEDVMHAFVLGAEAACRIGRHLGRAHYVAGFHQTATSGAFGATVAAGVLLGLSPQEMRQALSVVSTRASGLKSQFGTFGKPFHAGLAASNGVEAAILAASGFVAADDGYGGPQGFAATHAGEGDESAFAVPAGQFLFSDNQYKLHACCHGTHAMIEALLAAGGTDLARASAIEVRTNPRWLAVCDIKRPRTALELKFSYAALAGAVLTGFPTADPAAYTDEAATDARVTAIAQTVSVVADDALSDTASAVVVRMQDGETVRETHDLAAPVSALALFKKLAAKAHAVLGAEAEPILAAVDALPTMSARDLAAVVAR